MPFKSEPGLFESEPGMSKAISGLEALEEDAVKAQHQAAKPVIHTYELVAR
jgi:hypothetical protein